LVGVDGAGTGLDASGAILDAPAAASLAFCCSLLRAIHSRWRFRRVEGGFQKIIDLLTKKIQNEILTQWYGHAVSTQAISADRKRDLSLHKRIVDLKRFITVSNFDPRATALQVNKRADQIGTKLVELREHIAADQAKQKAK
jgi:hypothetical protein